MARFRTFWRLHYADVLLLTLVAALAAIIYAPLWHLGFWGDDWFLWGQGSRRCLLSLGLGPGARNLSQFTYVPLLGPSYRVDWLLFGDRFWLYNGGNFAWFLLVSCLAFLLLRILGHHRFWAAIAAVLVLCNPATVTVSGVCMTRHYLIGLAFALTSCCLLARWRRGGPNRWLFWAVLAYFLAILGKEVFAPLVVLVPFILAKEQRALAGRGFGLALAGYLILRRIFLGGFMGGYDTSYDPLVQLRTLTECFPRMAETLVYGGHVPGQVNLWAASIGAGVFLGCLLLPALAWRRPRASILVAVLLLVELATVLPTMAAPIIAYANDPLQCHGDRLVLPLTVTAWLLIAISLGTLEQRGGRVSGLCWRGLAVAMCAALFFLGARTKTTGWANEKPTWNQISFIWERLEAPNCFICPADWCASQIPELRQQQGGRVRAMVISPEQRPVWNTYACVYRLGKHGTIEATTDSAQAESWLDSYQAEFRRVLPYQWDMLHAQTPGKPQPAR
jgi:hypothetical protein